MTQPVDSRTRFPLNRNDVNYAQLAAEMTARLGYPVAICATAPQDAPDGVGWLILIGANGQALGAGIDPAVVAAVVAAHVPAAPEPDPLDILGTALVGATTVTGLRAALLEFVSEKKAKDPKDPKKKG